MQGKKKLCKLDSALYCLFLLAYGGVLIYLFYNQLINDNTGIFESDTVVHYRLGAQDRYFYSFSSYLYFVLSLFPVGRLWSAIVLSIVTVATVVLTRRLIIKLCEKALVTVSGPVANILSICLNLVMPFYVKAAHYKHYIGYQSPNTWHNSTYTLMRFFALLTVLVFISVYDTYKDGISLKNWLLLSGFMMLSAGVKSSFLTVFAPLMAIMLLADLFRGTKFSKVFILGCSVIPSMAVILWQSIMVFDGTGTGIGFAPFKVLSERSSNPKITVVLSVLFPLLVLFMHFRDFFKDRIYFGSLIMWGIGFAWVFFLTETGERSFDGNFMWGYSISLFFLFIVSTVMLLKDYYSGRFSKKIFYICLSVLIPVFVWHVISGIWFLILLLQGNTYFI